MTAFSGHHHRRPAARVFGEAKDINPIRKKRKGRRRQPRKKFDPQMGTWEERMARYSKIEEREQKRRGKGGKTTS